MSFDSMIHPPWWVAILIITAGAGIFWSGNRRMDRALKRVGIILAGLGILLGIISFVFPSDSQRMETRAKNIVAAVDKNNWDALAVLLDDQTAAGTVSKGIVRGRKLIVQYVQGNVQLFTISDVSELSAQTTRVDTDITVVMKISARSGTFIDRPVVIDCQFDFEKSGDRWLLEKITLLRIDGQDADSIFPHLR